MSKTIIEKIFLPGYYFTISNRLGAECVTVQHKTFKNKVFKKTDQNFKWDIMCKLEQKEFSNGDFAWFLLF